MKLAFKDGESNGKFASQPGKSDFLQAASGKPAQGLYQRHAEDLRDINRKKPRELPSAFFYLHEHNRHQIPIKKEYCTTVQIRALWHA